MDVSNIREMSLEEIQAKVLEMKEELFNLRFQHETSQLESPQKIKQVRRDIARHKTVIREFDLKEKTDN